MDSKPECSHTQTSRAFKVEVRARNKPLVLDGWGVIGSEWTGMPTQKVINGTAMLRPEDDLTFTLSYYGAIAIAASFLSYHPYYSGLECRLVEYKRVITHTLEKVGEKDLLGEIERSFALTEFDRAQSREGTST
jgi:hypothetical protein